MAVADFLAGIEHSVPVMAFNESLFAYPIVEGTHLLGLAVAVGLLALVDLRLAGWFLAERPVEEVIRDLRPWFIGGFAAVIGTGILLFLSKASVFYVSPLFWAKMGLVVLAGLNALYFEFNHQRSVRGAAGTHCGQWASSKVSGLVSLFFWIVIVVLGRLLAYFQQNGA